MNPVTPSQLRDRALRSAALVAGALLLGLIALAFAAANWPHIVRIATFGRSFWATHAALLVSATIVVLGSYASALYRRGNVVRPLWIDGLRLVAALGWAVFTIAAPTTHPAGEMDILVGAAVVGWGILGVVGTVAVLRAGLWLE